MYHKKTKGSTNTAWKFKKKEAENKEDDEEKQQRIKEIREQKKLKELEIDKQLFGPQMETTKQLGWLVNFRSTSIPEKFATINDNNEENLNTSNMDLAALVLYFISDEGDYFTVTKTFEPYFYISVKDDNSISDVTNYLTSLDENISIELSEKEDLGLPNHLAGIKAKYMKIKFKNVQQLMEMRSKLIPIIEQNKKKEDTYEMLDENILNSSEEEDDFADELDDNERNIRRKRKAHLSTRDCVDKIIDMREFDIKYHIRCAIDTDLRVGYWYDITMEGGNVEIVQRNDIEERAVPKVCAFDIETTKPPLMFPDASTDSIMMISYMIDGQGYLIVNREIVSEDIDDFDYTPKEEFPGPFEVFNVENEEELLRKWFSHMREEKPIVYVTYNGDTFDWPFIDERAKVYGMKLKDEIGYYRVSGDSKKLGSDIEYGSTFGVHIDCLYWVVRDSYLPQGSHGLKNVTRSKLKFDPIEVDPEDMVPFASTQPQKLAAYSVSDAVSTYYLYMKYINPFIFSLCNIIPMPPDEVLRKGSGTLCETLLMVQAFKANIIFPNRYQSDPEKLYKGHLLYSETYIGGRVEGLKSGVYRSDIPYQFNLNPDRYQQLVDNADRALRFAIEVEEKLKIDDVTNFEEIKQQVIEMLLDLKNNPNRTECPKIYHLDVGAMYPNIILTHRLQPPAVVNEDHCARCIYNRPENDCKRKMGWNFRAEYYSATKSEFNMIKKQLIAENANYTVEELRKRVGDYSQKVHKKKYQKESIVKEATICQRENPFYVNTVREFRDRRYVLKDKWKEWQDKAKDPELGEKSKVMLVLYESLQLAHKCILNSFYGYVMRKAARWYSMEMAGVVTYNGAQIIRMARELIDDIGISLELDTDGIWCMLPSSFPENFTLKLKNGRKRVISYPCLMLNADVAQNFSNTQYQTYNPETGQYEKSSECSIFFEVDGPYGAMILPAAKEEGKSIKKRYAVFRHDGSLAELKGFEVKRRGELKLIKIFQSQVFEQFLKGGTLEECYQHVAEVANKWLDILYTKGEGIETKQLFEYITESSNMSKKLEEYGKQKSARITTAKRLVDMFGDQMVKDNKLVCSYIVAKKPENSSVTERVIPTVVFQKEESVCLDYLRKWTKDKSLNEIDLKEIVDWDYYIERLGSAIQKIITIPAALQLINNPVPRVKHPDWLLKKLKEDASQSKQRKLTDMFKRKEDIMDVENLGDIVSDHSGDEGTEETLKEDMGSDDLVQIQSKKNKATKRKFNKLDKQFSNLEPLKSSFFEDKNYADWLSNKKQQWKSKREKRKKVKMGIYDEEDDEGSSRTIALDGTMASFVQLYTSQLKDLTWQVVEIRETDTPGVLRLFICVGGHLRHINIKVPRIIYLNFYRKTEENIQNGIPETKKKLPPMSNLLIGGETDRKTYLYKYEFEEFAYQQNLQELHSFFSDPSIQGVYEKQIDPIIRTIQNVGCLCKVHPRSKSKLDNTREVISLFDLVPVQTKVHKHTKGISYLNDVSSTLRKLYLFESNSDVRGLLGLFSFANKRVDIFVIHAVDVQTSSIHPERILNEVLELAKDNSDSPITEITEFEITSCRSRGEALRLINNILAKEKKAPTLLIVQSPHGFQSHSSTLENAPMLNEIPIISIPFNDEDNKYQHALSGYWTNQCIKQMFIRYCSIEKWYNDMLKYSNYCGVPIGNIESNDFIVYLLDMVFAKSLREDYVLWLSTGNKPDLGGCEDDAIQCHSYLNDEQSYSRSGSFINHSSCYHSVCVEFELSHLDTNSILQSGYINDGIDVENTLLQNSQFASVQDVFKQLKQIVSSLFADVHSDNTLHPEVPDLLISNLNRWCSNAHSKTYHPELYGLVFRLQKKVFLQLCAHLKKSGCRLVYANFHKIIIDTGKNTVSEANIYVDYIIKSLQQQKLFTWIDIQVNNIWNNLLWMNQDNYLGIKEVEQEDSAATSLTCDTHIDILSDTPQVVQVQLVLFLSMYMYECHKFKQASLDKLSKLKPEEYTKLLEDQCQDYLSSNYSGKLMEAVSNQFTNINTEENRDFKLDFINTVCHLLSLDLLIREEVNLLKRSLLKLIGVKEFSNESVFKRNQKSFRVTDLICSYCSSCTDIDLCKHDVNFKCSHCGNEYDKHIIEGKLIEYVNNRIIGYQLQDLQCAKCSQICADHLAESCSCSGKWIPAKAENKLEKVQEVFGILSAAAKKHNFEILLTLVESASFQ